LSPRGPVAGRLGELPPEDRPREKLVARGADALTDEELVAILLGTGRPGAGVLETAREILRGNGLRGLLARSERGRVKELARGIGTAKACRLAAAAELARRLSRAEVEGRPLIDAPEAAGAYLSSTLAAELREVMGGLLLDAKNRLVHDEVVFRGGVTSASPHIGHAYTALASDALARFQRLDGKDVFFLTGTDEHGQKMQQTAVKDGITPQALADRNSAVFRDLMVALNASPDDFIRTTEERHHRASEEIWRRMEAAGDIYLDTYSGWYSVRQEGFFDEKETTVGDDGVRREPLGSPVEWVEEESYFFRLSAFQDRLLAHYAKNPDFIGPDERRNEVVSFVKGGLKDLSISRTTFDWGIKVPGAPKHVMYVWVDALTNYITAAGFPDEQAPRWRYWPADLHVIGKDILRFHAVYWPAFLWSAGVELPKRVYAHGFLFNRGEKMSKSVGNVVAPGAAAEVLGRLGAPKASEDLGPADLAWGGLPLGVPLAPAAPLFPRADPKAYFADAPKETAVTEETRPVVRPGEPAATVPAAEPSPAPVAPAASPAAPAAPAAEPARITIDDFFKADLRVAEIVAAEKVEKSKKLMKMRVRLGEEERTIVAGIATAYAADELVGRKVVVVANLAPAKLMGIESNGMVLAASLPGSGEPSLLAVDPSVPSGTKVK
jgi:methionine--tRNA ligase beta chain